MDLSKFKLAHSLCSSASNEQEKYVRKPTPFVKINATAGDYMRFGVTDSSYKFKIDEKWYGSVVEYLCTKEDLNKIEFKDMVTPYLAKFRACWELKRALNGTGNSILVYCDPEDQTLSCGFAEDDERADLPHTWTGRNLLGYVLMQVRCELKEDWKVENLSGDGKIIKKQKKSE